MRAYRRIEDYYADRVDMHKSANIWPLLGNLLSTDRIEPHVFTDGGKITPVAEPAAPEVERKKRRPPKPAPVPENGNPLDDRASLGVNSEQSGEFPDSNATLLTH